MFCDHNEKLASRGFKKFFKIVTVIFIYFAEKYLGILYVDNISTNVNRFIPKNPM
jgi:hypothetical protein